MAQNENGEETQKSEHDSACVIVSSTIVLSLSEADGGRCGQQVVHQKVPAAVWTSDVCYCVDVTFALVDSSAPVPGR